MKQFLNQARKSWTLNINLITALLIGLQDNLGLLQLPDKYHQYALFIVILLNIILRFKTTKAIADK